jgi:hypothetical protein
VIAALIAAMVVMPLCIRLFMPALPERDIDATSLAFALRASGYQPAPQFAGKRWRRRSMETTRKEWLGATISREELISLSSDEIRRRLTNV